MKFSHVPNLQAAAGALFVQVVGLLVAFVPSAAEYKQIIIGAGSTLLGIAFMIANAQHAKANATVVAATGISPATPGKGV